MTVIDRTPDDFPNCCTFCGVRLGEDELHVVSVRALASGSPGCFAFRIAAIRSRLDLMLTGSTGEMVHIGSDIA